MTVKTFFLNVHFLTVERHTLRFVMYGTVLAN